MLSKVVFGFALLGLALAQANDYPVQFNIQPSQEISMPYPYQGSLVKRFAVPEKSYYDDEYVFYPVGHDVEEVPESSLSLISPVKSLISYLFSSVSLILAVGSKVLTIAKKLIVHLFPKLGSLALGSILALGFCKLTPYCSKLAHLTSLDYTEMKEEVQAIATPERVTRAAEFLQKAFDKYSAMQNQNGPSDTVM